MENTNDSGVDTQETSTGEGVETNSNSSSQDLSAVMAKLEEFGSDIASLKRTAKKVTKTEKTETPTTNNIDSSELSQKVEQLSLQVAGITEQDEVKLAKDLQSETGMSIDKLLSSKYFKAELEDLRTSRANAEATTGVNGDQGGSKSAKDTAAYWIAKGEYPTREQVSDKSVRAEIRKAFVDKETGGGKGKFYNS